MIVRGRDRTGKMPCESCAVQFSVFKRKRSCCECERYYCSGCLRRGGGAMCTPCRVLSTRPLSRQTIAHLKVRDLQCFLQRQNVSTRGCVEKEELVNLCISHVNSSAYKRRGQGGNSNPFSSLKGLTNNINDFINSAFDLRTTAPHPAPPPTTRNCYNSSHAHPPTAPEPPAPEPTAPPSTHHERFSVTPGGERDIYVPVPESQSSTSLRSPSEETTHVDTADCLEIEDLDDQSWELINRPADPLPNDSDVLLTATESTEYRREAVSEDDRSSSWEREENASGGEGAGSGVGGGGGGGSLLRPELRSGERAASELDLRPRSTDTGTDTDTASLQDEPLMNNDTGRKQVALEQLKRMSELDALSVRQLKELLQRNRVEYRGCIERADLLHRARTLWRNHARDDEVERLPLEECCKICMAAPLECVLLECGHLATCTACAKRLAECPICRQYVVRPLRVFRS